MYEIVGTYRGEKEVIDETDSISDARYLVGEYRLAFGPEWIINWRKAKKKK